jgi:hypothetical protein
LKISMRNDAARMRFVILKVSVHALRWRRPRPIATIYFP